MLSSFQPITTSHFSSYSGAGHSRQNVTMSACSVQTPTHHYTVRRPVWVVSFDPKDIIFLMINFSHNDAYKSVNPAPKSYNNFRPMHQHPRSNMVFVDSPQTQQTNSSNVVLLPWPMRYVQYDSKIDVSLLALLAEKALDSFGIFMDKQIWFEAIMMVC